jgi:branched-chain amino acid aminotransferase
MLVYVDGRFFPREQAVVSVFDHGFLYGDGVYETMRAYDGRIHLLEKHMLRLRRSARAISLRLPLSRARLADALSETLNVNKLLNAYVRIQISRGPGEPGLDPALCPAPTMVIIAKPFNDYPREMYEQGVRVALVDTRRNHPLALPPAVKSTNFLNNVLAKIEAKKRKAFEGVMLSWQGYVAEGTVSNIFLVRKGVLLTPAAETGILEGVTRGEVLRLAARLKIRVKETLIKPAALLSADECFLTNTTMEIMPVTRLGTTRVGNGRPGPITRQLHDAYRKEVTTWLRTRVNWRS